MNASKQKRGKSPKKILWITLFTILVAGILGETTWFILRNGEESGKIEDTGDKTSESSTGEDTIAISNMNRKITELSINDELVQKLYGQFDRGAGRYIWPRLLNGADDELKLVVALLNQQAQKCHGDYGQYYGEGQYNPYTLEEPWLIGENYCLSGNGVMAKVKEIFGRNLVLQNKQIVQYHCIAHVYDAKNDEFIPLAGGCSGSFDVLVRGLYAVEMHDDTLFLYEVAVYKTWSDLNDPGTTVYYLVAEDGNYLGEPFVLGDNIDSHNVPQHKDVLSRFKWTFTWNGENYIFESLEKI